MRGRNHIAMEKTFNLATHPHHHHCEIDTGAAWHEHPSNQQLHLTDTDDGCPSIVQPTAFLADIGFSNRACPTIPGGTKHRFPPPCHYSKSLRANINRTVGVAVSKWQENLATLMPVDWHAPVCGPSILSASPRRIQVETL